jgi:hypothetical protein
MNENSNLPFFLLAVQTCTQLNLPSKLAPSSICQANLHRALFAEQLRAEMQHAP